MYIIAQVEISVDLKEVHFKEVKNMFMESNRPFEAIKGLSDTLNSGYNRTVDGVSGLLNQGNRNLLNGRLSQNEKSFDRAMDGSAQAIARQQQSGSITRNQAAGKAVEAGHNIRNYKRESNYDAHQKYMNSRKNINQASNFAKSGRGKGSIAGLAIGGVLGVGALSSQ